MVLVVLGVAPTALAEETNAGFNPFGSTGSTSPKGPRPVKAIMDERKEEAKDRAMEVKNKMASTAEMRKDKMASTTQRIQEKKGEIKDRIASTSSARREKMKEELKKKFDRMIKRIEATIQRQETIMGKINARISKIKTGGGNTTEAEKFVSDAKTKIDTAKTDLQTLKTTAASGAQDLSTTTDSVKKETLDKMRDVNKNIEKNLKEAHNLLEKALGSLKGMSQLNNGRATTTPSATTTGTN